jgi:hypothetical protein
MIGGRHFSDVIDVRAQRGANIDLDHILVVITLRTKICRVYTTRKDQQRRRFAVESLKSERLEYEFHSAHDVQIKHAASINFCMELKRK